MLQQIIWIFEKELRYALRDTDVLIYSVLVPLLFYPGLLLVGSEVLLWQMSEAQRNLRVYITDPQHLAPHLYTALTHVEGIKMTVSANPKHDLEIGKLDAIVTGENGIDSYRFVTYVGSKKGVLAANKLNQALVTAQSEEQHKAYKSFRVPANLLNNVCKLNETRLVPFTPTQAKVESHAPWGIIGALVLGLLQVGLTAGVTGVCVLAEEKEKKTFETTLSLPVASYVLTTGKWLASSIMSLVSGLINIIAMGAAGAVVFLQIQSMQKEQNLGQLLPALFTQDAWSSWLAIAILILCAGLSSALCMLFVSACKTFKDAQAIVTYPMLFIITFPLLAFIPGIEQSSWIYWVPFANLLICLKHPQGHYLNLSFALLETLAITALSLSLCGRIFFAEKYNFALSEGRPNQSPQRQTDSV